RKDQVLQMVPPYGKDDVKVIYATLNRITSLQYSDDCQMIFLTQTVNSQRQITAVDLKDPKTEYVIYRTGVMPPADNPSAPPPDLDDDEQPPAGRGGRGGQAGNAGTSLLTRPSRSEARVVRISSTGDVYLSGSDRAGAAPP